jgi:hypothetical protein
MRFNQALLALIVAGGVLHLANCTTGQRKDARTALQAIDAACDALEVTQLDGRVTLACELTDDLRDVAIEALRPKKKRKAPKPVASAGGGSP